MRSGSSGKRNGKRWKLAKQYTDGGACHENMIDTRFGLAVSPDTFLKLERGRKIKRKAITLPTIKFRSL